MGRHGLRREHRQRPGNCDGNGGSCNRQRQCAYLSLFQRDVLGTCFGHLFNATGILTVADMQQDKQINWPSKLALARTQFAIRI
jgi:hypothetical protein